VINDPNDRFAALMAAVAEDDATWFMASNGMCGHCGNDGKECICVEGDPCGCRYLHTMGSARLSAYERMEADLDAYKIDGQGVLDLDD
jgi:hypothetical protein